MRLIRGLTVAGLLVAASLVAAPGVGVAAQPQRATAPVFWGSAPARIDACAPGDRSSADDCAIGGALSAEERAVIALMDPKDRARYLLQKRIAEKAEIAVLLSQLQNLRHSTALSIINNIR